MEDANFEDSSINDSCWTIYENNIQTLLIEIYKSLNHVSPPIMQEFFDLKVTPSSLRNKNLLKLPKTNTSRYSTQAVHLDETPLDAVKKMSLSNVKGIQSIKKRLKLIEYFKSKITTHGILFLEETHSSSNDEQKWRVNFGSNTFISHGKRNSCGV